MDVSFLTSLQVRCQKIALSSREDIDWDDFVALPKSQIVVERQPYPHVVVDSFLKDWAYEGLVARFRNLKDKGLSNAANDFARLHPFEINYDGYLYSPPATLDPDDAQSIFFSLCWNRFFSNLFSQTTGFETALAFHHHPAGDRTGFVHNDFSDKNFLRGSWLANGVVPYAIADGNGGVLRRRIIALLLFLDNPPWEEGNGGELGLYASDGRTLVKKVAPINNRLVAFHIGPQSFHAFQGNHVPRTSIVQWFHMPGRPPI